MPSIPDQIQKSQQFKRFTSAIHNDYTSLTYVAALGDYIASAGAKTAKNLFGSAVQIEERILKWIGEMKIRKLQASTMRGRIYPVRLFYEMNRTPVAWKIIQRTVPLPTTLKDIGWTREEMQEMLKFARLREQAIIPLLASTGCRRGVIPRLRMRNLKPRDEFKIYQITCYEGEREEYVAYCSPEARANLDKYIGFRKMKGEDLTPDSFVFRLEWNEDDPKAAKRPRGMKDRAVTSAINQVVFDSGVREQVKSDTRNKASAVRHGKKLLHGFRKFYETTMLDNGFDENWMSKLKGEKMKGLRQNYYKPKDDTLLIGVTSADGKIRKPGYVDIMRELVISDEERAKIKVKELEMKIIGEEAMVKRMDEMEEELNDLRQKEYWRDVKEHPEQHPEQTRRQRS